MNGKTEAPGEHAGDLLRRIRAERGLTQEDLAERFPGGISIDTISNIERGRVRPRRGTLLGLMDALGLDESGRSAVLEAWRGQVRLDPLSADAPRYRLPTPITAIFGREHEMETLTGLLADGDVRLVTLTGPGGVGKTRLALAAAEAVGPSFRNGVAFIDLTAVREPERFLTAIALELGLADAGDRPVQERLVAHLESREMLLVLDNSEGVVDGSARLMPLLAQCPGLKLLVTSREALRLSGEYELPVSPLPLPQAGATSIQELASVPSVQLLLQRGRMVSPGLKLTETNSTSIAQICSRLDGLPLALELAGARLKHLAPEALAVRLERALSVLVDGPRDLPERHRTLRATIDWSYALLTEPEQRLLRRLAVFVDGFTTEGVMRVCADGAATLDDDAAEAALAGLLDKNLLRVIDDGSDAEPRFGMLETVREYVEELLARHSERSIINDRHAVFFCELAEAGFPAMYSADRTHWLALLLPEVGNLNAALRWCLDRDGDREVGIRIAGALGRFWYFTGLVNEGREWLRKALAATAASRASLPRARALSSASKLAWVQGDYLEAVSLAELSVAASAEFPDEWVFPESLTILGYTLVSAGRHAEAVPVYQQSIEEGRRLAAVWHVGFTLAMASEALRLSGDVALARQYVDEAFVIFDKLGDLWGIGVANAMAAGLMKDMGDLEALVQHLERAQAALEGTDVDTYAAVRLRIMRAYIGLIARSDIQGSARDFDEGLTLAQEMGQTVYILVAIAGVGAIATFAGRLREAAILFASASSVLEPGAIHVDDGGKAAREAYTQCMLMIKGVLPEDQLAEVWEEGCNLPVEKAVELARTMVRDLSGTTA